MQEETEFKPKAMVKVGEWPILLHIMNMYAGYDYKEFVLCLGYKGEMIRDYFLNFRKTNNDIELDLSSGEIKELKRGAKLDYKVAFIDLGLVADTGHRVMVADMRLKGAKDYDDAMVGASRGGHREIVAEMIARGAIAYDRAMREATIGGHGEIVEDLRQYRDQT